MSSTEPITLTLDRRLLEHPRSYHLRRMRQGVWLYLDLLARLPAGADTLEVDPQAVGVAMGLHEGTVRSWLGHLHHAGYLQAKRLNGVVSVQLRPVRLPAPPVMDRIPTRFFTAEKIARALGEPLDREALDAALRQHPDSVIRRALAGAMAVPGEQIRRSRTALFLYLLKRHATS